MHASLSPRGGKDRKLHEIETVFITWNWWNWCEWHIPMVYLNLHPRRANIVCNLCLAFLYAPGPVGLSWTRRKQSVSFIFAWTEELYIKRVENSCLWSHGCWTHSFRSKSKCSTLQFECTSLAPRIRAGQGADTRLIASSDWVDSALCWFLLVNIIQRFLNYSLCFVIKGLYFVFHRTPESAEQCLHTTG